MKTIDKINHILSLLINENQDFGITCKAVYWKMGTSFFTMFDRLFHNLKNKDISFKMTTFEDINHKTVEGGNKSFILVLNNENITPCKVRGYVSEAAIHQYARSIKCFGLGVIEQRYKNWKDFVEQKGEINLVSNVLTLLEPNNRINLIKYVILNSFFSNIQDQRNISYSILIEVLSAFNFDFQNLISDNRIFRFNKSYGSRNNKKDRFLDLYLDWSTIKQDIKKQGTIATYKEIIECIQTHYNDLDEFINDIWNEYEEKSDNSNQDKLISKQIYAQNLIQALQKKRSEFKNNIFNNRLSKGLIKNKNDLYSDILDIQNSTHGLLAKFNECEAAHIYEVNTIKKQIQIEEKLKKEETNELLNYVCDPNNGIIMRPEYHKSFDRRQWFFDINGNMIIPKENEEYLLNVLNLKRIKINPKILNEEMKKFLEKRD